MTNTYPLLQTPRGGHLNLHEAAHAPTACRALDFLALFATQLPPVDHVLVVAPVFTLGARVR